MGTEKYLKRLTKIISRGLTRERHKWVREKDNWQRLGQQNCPKLLLKQDDELSWFFKRADGDNDAKQQRGANSSQ